jgi:hypothetical protein
MNVGGGANGPYSQGDYRDPDDSGANCHPPKDFGDAFSRAASGIERRLRTGAPRKRHHAYQEDTQSRAISAVTADASEKKVDDGWRLSTMPFVYD